MLKGAQPQGLTSWGEVEKQRRKREQLCKVYHSLQALKSVGSSVGKCHRPWNHEVYADKTPPFAIRSPIVD